MTKYLLFTLFYINETNVFPDANKFVPEYYCFSTHTGKWYKLEKNTESISKSKWAQRWNEITITRVPQEHRAIALVMS
jgi:hypothetical protein